MMFVSFKNISFVHFISLQLFFIDCMKTTTTFHLVTTQGDQKTHFSLDSLCIGRLTVFQALLSPACMIFCLSPLKRILEFTHYPHCGKKGLQYCFIAPELNQSEQKQSCEIAAWFITGCQEKNNESYIIYASLLDLCKQLTIPV